MPKEIIAIDPALSATLCQAKATLADAQKLVEAAESAIYLAAGKLPEHGTTYVTGCKIETGFYEKYSDDELAKAETQWPQVSNLPFPFKKVYKAIGKDVSYIRENAKDAYKLIENALTLSPKKPAFTLTNFTLTDKE